MRLFVGIALNEDAKQALERLTLRLRAKDDGLRWSLPEQWHITLVFLGEIEAAAIKGLEGELGKLRSDEIALEMDGLGVFERAGILYAAVEVLPGLAKLQRSVEAVARGCGVEVEERPYRPHITLARSRNRDGRQTLERLRDGLERQRLQERWSANEFVLYVSEASPEGARYRVLRRFPLAGIPKTS